MPAAPILCRRRRCYAAGADSMPPAPMLCRRTHCCYVWGGGRCSLIKCQLSTGNLGLPPPSPPSPHYQFSTILPPPPHTTWGAWITLPWFFLPFLSLLFFPLVHLGSHVDKITYLLDIFTAPCIMILRRENDITWVIVFVVWKVSPVLGPNRPRYARAIPGPKTGSTFHTTNTITRVM